MTLKIKKLKEDNYEVYCLSENELVKEEMNTSEVLSFFNDTASEFVKALDNETKSESEG